MSGRLDGKVALVTGGCGGMGVSHARALAREGGRVVIADLDDAHGRDVAETLGDAVSFIALDVTSTPQWASAVAQVERTFGRLDVLVNNAGIVDFAPID